MNTIYNEVVIMNTYDSKSKTVVYTLRLPKALHEKLVNKAEQLNISISAYLKMTLTKLLDD
nr:MAG TPA: plasmid partition protein ParG-helix-helix, dimer, DNA binding, CELL [Caudoviricetes sp.]